jgi:hypothetical protein
MDLAKTNDSSLYDVDAGRYDKCDYKLLFSHLPDSFRHLAHFQLQQFLLLHNAANNQLSTIGGPTTTTSSGTTTTTHHPTAAAHYDQQSVQKLCYALVALVVGLFYSLIGYRFLKLSTFLIGFSLGSSIIYLILSEQKQLTLVENLIISLSIGCLFAFVALLVQYIGLFLLGITSSISIVTCILILIDLFHTNKSAWLCILLLFTCATIVASITLKFQKSLTIFNTSAIGSGLLLISLDYFVENNLLIDYIYELYKVNGNSFNIFERQRALLKSGGDSRIAPRMSTLIGNVLSTTVSTVSTNSKIRHLNATKVNATISGDPTMTTTTTTSNSNSALALFLHLYSSAHARLCWYTWLIFGIYFILLISSILVQYLITGKNYDHRDTWQKRKTQNFVYKRKAHVKCRIKKRKRDHETFNFHPKIEYKVQHTLTEFPTQFLSTKPNLADENYLNCEKKSARFGFVLEYNLRN